MEEYYAKNKNDFLWDRRVIANTYACSDETIATKVKKELKRGKNNGDISTLINKESQLNLRIEEGTFTTEDQEILSKIDWKTGVSKNVSLNGQIIFADIKEIIEPSPKGLDEAKGMITASYQNHLEANWIEELRNKYKYSVNTDVLYSIIH